MEKITKRQFIKRGLAGTCGLYCLGINRVAGGNNSDGLWKYSHEGMFYSVTPRGVRCEVCPNECDLRPGEISTCNNRINSNGKLFSIAYGNPCAVHIDPIEKKPLLHFYPSTSIFSIATAGCNFVCLNCQNWEISQTSPYKTQNIELFPRQVVESCIENKCPSIAYTYSEPVSFYEYMFDTSKIAHEQNIMNVMVSNGYINEAPLKKLVPYLDAANIDLKSFNDDIYMRLTAGKLQPVLNTLKIFKDSGVWLEITNLVVPSWTDDFDMIKKMCEWLVANGFSNYPLHFSRFHPSFKLTQLPETPLQTLIRAREIAINSGCNYVYIGNVPGKGFENTYCPKCKNLVIERRGYTILSVHMKNGKCENCGRTIEGRWG
jgi:pyruvate formate lyase activating enzyme